MARGEEGPVRPRVSAVGAGWLALTVAWVVCLLGIAHGHHPATDVSDSLGRAGYIAERVLPFDYVTLAADGAAFLFLYAAWQAGRLKAWGWLAGVLWAASGCLHGFMFLIHSIVAG